MDRTDYQILNILQADCRATLKCIGDQVGLTAPAVSERVRRMEEKGVIRDFRIDIDRARLDSGMTGFILVALEPEKYNSFCEFCRNDPGIISHYHVIGVFNALLLRRSGHPGAGRAAVRHQAVRRLPDLGGAEDLF